MGGIRSFHPRDVLYRRALLPGALKRKLQSRVDVLSARVGDRRRTRLPHDEGTLLAEYPRRLCRVRDGFRRGYRRDHHVCELA